MLLANQQRVSSASMEMEHCCFCKRPSGNRKQFQRLFGTASNLLCGTITDNISNLLGSRLSLQHAIPQNSIICKDCRLLFVNCDKKQRELRALETRVRSLLEEAFPNLVRRTLKTVSFVKTVAYYSSTATRNSVN